MKNFDTRVYNISDFKEWDESGLLDLSPDFQRRAVWTEKAKSYLIDTIIRGKPIPKILITQHLTDSRNIRTVVDGQQRLRAILEFMSDAVRISKAHNREFANMTWSRLDSAVKQEFLKYEIGVDVLFDTSYADILDIFARVNTYSVKLNKQENLNAKYLGFFKQTAFSIGYTNVNYWLDSGVLTSAQISRMGEAALASDLLVATIDGIQTNKNIESFYKKYEDKDAKLEVKADNLEMTMRTLGEIYSAEELKQTNFSRIHLFYSLVCTIYHCLFGIPNLPKNKRTKLTKKQLPKVRVALDELSARYDAEDESDGFDQFIDASRRATTDTSVRKFRSEFILDYINRHI